MGLHGFPWRSAVVFGLAQVYARDMQGTSRPTDPNWPNEALSWDGIPTSATGWTKMGMVLSSVDLPARMVDQSTTSLGGLY
jgi:hypothetical protein